MNIRVMDQGRGGRDVVWVRTKWIGDIECNCKKNWGEVESKDELKKNKNKNRRIKDKSVAIKNKFQVIF